MRGSGDNGGSFHEFEGRDQEMSKNFVKVETKLGKGRFRTGHIVKDGN